MNIFDLRNLCGQKQKSTRPLDKNGTWMEYIPKIIVNNLSKNSFLSTRYCFEKNWPDFIDNLKNLISMQVKNFIQEFSQFNFIGKIYESIINSKKFPYSKLAIFTLYSEILVSIKIPFKTHPNQNLKIFFTHLTINLRYLIIFLNTFKKALLNLSKTNQCIFFSVEHQEILRIYYERNEIFLYTLLNKNFLGKKNKIWVIKKNFNIDGKWNKNLFIIRSFLIGSPKYNAVLYISIMNSILLNKSSLANFYVNLFRRQKLFRKVLNNTKNIFKFLRKEMFLCSIHLFKKIISNCNRLRTLSGIKHLIFEIYGKFSYSIYDFCFLKEFLILFRNLRKHSFSFYLSKKDHLIVGKSFASKILNRLFFKNQYFYFGFSKEKKVIKEFSNYIIKELILSNSLKRFGNLVWFFMTFKSLKNALETSWRIQITKRYTDFFEINSDQSMKFNYKILIFIKKYLKKSFLEWSERFARDFCSNSNFSKKPFVFIVLMEKFFLYCYNNSGFNSKILSKHLKRILILGNFYLLNILRTKNLIRDLDSPKKSQFCTDNGLKKNNLFKFFNRKTELLLKNLNNSLKFLEGFFC
jgi:hypothetical protein